MSKEKKMIDGIAERIKRVAEIHPSKKKEKAEALLKEVKECPQVLSMLKYIYKDGIKFRLPEGEPPYKPIEKKLDVQNVLFHELRKIKYFIDSPENKNLRQFKVEQMFIEMLESVDPDDAKLLIGMKDKKIAFKSLTKNFVMETLPNETKGW